MSAVAPGVLLSRADIPNCLPCVAGRPRLTVEQYAVFVTVPKSCYPSWEVFEDELYDHGWYDEMLFLRELRAAWKYVVRFQRDWDYQARRFYTLSEVVGITRSTRLKVILESGEETKVSWTELQLQARSHGAERLP